MKKINTAVIGAGKIAHIHARALKSIELSELKAVFSWHLNKAQVFAGEYNIHAYDDIEEMIRKEDIRMVTVCTPHPVHLSNVLISLNAGSHVLVEKPLAITLEDCDKMIITAREKNLNLGMISQRRLYQPVIRVKEAIESGKLGKPVLGVVTMYGWRDREYYEEDAWRGKWKEEGGGVLVNQAPHQLDILQWYMGPVEEIIGYWSNFNHPYIEVEDTALAIIKFRSGALGSILVSNSQNPALYGKVHVFGNNGAAAGVQTDGGAMFIAGKSGIAEPPYNDLWTISGEENLKETWKKEDSEFFSNIDPIKYFHQWQIEDFLESIIDHRSPMITGEEGRKTVEIFTAIYRSNETGLPVKFPLNTAKGD